MRTLTPKRDRPIAAVHQAEIGSEHPISDLRHTRWYLPSQTCRLRSKENRAHNGSRKAGGVGLVLAVGPGRLDLRHDPGAGP